MDSYQTDNQPKMFTGGALETNAYLLSTPAGNILIDAPDGAGVAFRDTPIALLLLTHGHFDHVWDAAMIVREHGCQVAMHGTTEQMLADRNLLKRFGLDLEVEPVAASILLQEGANQQFPGLVMDVLEVPGHCPGSLCFYDRLSGNLFGGDVLFAGGIGRWDLPGGDHDLLLKGIHGKILSLPDSTIVYSGHGPATRIGLEKRTNPYLQDS